MSESPIIPAPPATLEGWKLSSVDTTVKPDGTKAEEILAEGRRLLLEVRGGAGEHFKINGGLYRPHASVHLTPCADSPDGYTAWIYGARPCGGGTTEAALQRYFEPLAADLLGRLRAAPRAWRLIVAAAALMTEYLNASQMRTPYAPPPCAARLLAARELGAVKGLHAEEMIRRAHSARATSAEAERAACDSAKEAANLTIAEADAVLLAVSPFDILSRS